MGTCLRMLRLSVSLALFAFISAQGVPGNVQGLDPDSSAATTLWQRRLALADLIATIPATPGNVPGLVPGSPAAAEWWNAQIAHAAQLAYQVNNRQADHLLTPRNVPSLVPGSPVSAEGWNVRISQAGHYTHGADRKQGRHSEVSETPGLVITLSPEELAEWQAGWDALREHLSLYWKRKPEGRTFDRKPEGRTEGRTFDIVGDLLANDEVNKTVIKSLWDIATKIPGFIFAQIVSHMLYGLII